jgi:hypothetical protein
VSEDIDAARRRPPDRVPAAADALQAIRDRDGRPVDRLRDHRPGHPALHEPGDGIPADGVDEVRRPSRVTRRGVAGVVALLAVTAVAAQSCQQSQIRFSKEAAIDRARPEAGFAPQRTQVRLVRQGLTGHPFWAVSFSVTAPSGDGYAKLTTVRVDANTGVVETVNRER